MIDNLPLVSIIIPCYRLAHLLPEALQSVFDQRHPAVEAVVVNDGSPDDTDRVVQPYLSRITYVRQENRGPSAARNAGVRASSGRYLLFLDADDLLHPRAIEWLTEAAGGRDDCLVIMGYRSFRQSPTEPGAREMVFQAGDLLPVLIHENFGPPLSFLCARAAGDRVGWFEESLCVLGCEDWDLWARLALAGASSVTVPRVGGYYRLLAGSLSANWRRMMASRVQVLLRMHQLIIRTSELLRRWGWELLTAELRVRRRCLIHRASPELVHELTRAIRQLGERGYHTKRSVSKSLLDAIVGQTNGERLAMAYYKRFLPAVYEIYQRSYT
jgi:glycosyltransferase involved in cell wall biosynthesis